MRITSNKQRKVSKKTKVAIVISLIALVVIIASLFALFIYPQIKSAWQNNDALKSIDANKQESIPQEGTNNTSSTGEVNDSKSITPTDPGKDVSSIETPSVTRAEVNSNGQVRIAAIFSQAAYGDCVVTFTRDGQSDVVRSASIILQASYYACNGFLIPASDFPSKGEWSFTLSHEYSGLKATTNKQTIIIK